MYTGKSINFKFAPNGKGVKMAGKASTRAKNKYNAENYERISLVVPKGKKEAIKNHAESRGESLNGFISRAIDETMQHDKENS